MRLLLLCLFFSTGCSFRQWYPTAGAGAAAVTASAVGAGPVVVGLSSAGGALVGEVARGNEEVAEAKETISKLTHGDVSALVEAGLASHKTGFEQFTATVKKILLVAAAFLGIYLIVPIFVARKCSITEAKKQTRPPFRPPPR